MVLILCLLIDRLELVHVEALLLLLSMVVFSLFLKVCWLIGKPLHHTVIDVLPDADALAASVDDISHWLTFDLEEDRDNLLSHPSHI